MSETKDAGNGTANGGGSRQGNFIAVAATVVAGIGTLGWITFLGGALLWISFGQASLPSAEAVARVPTGVLVATGVEFVVAAALAATVIVLILFLLDDYLHRLVDRARLRGVRKLKQELEDLRARERQATELADQKRRAVAKIKSDLDQADPGARATAADTLSKAAKDLGDAERELESIQNNVLEKTEEVIEASKPDWRERARRYFVGGLVGLAALLGAYLIDLGQGPLTFLGWIAVIVATLLASVVGITLYTTIDDRAIKSAETGGEPTGLVRYRFPVIGLVVFVAVPVVMAIGVYFRAGNAPRVEPLALLRSDGTPLPAFFIAETSDRVFLGTFEQSVECTQRSEGCEKNRSEGLKAVAIPPRMVSLPKTEIRNLSIGPLLPLNAEDAEEDKSGRGRPRTAREWAGSTALVLCNEADQARARHMEAAPPTERAGGSTDTLPPPTCSAEDLAALQTFVNAEQASIRKVLRESSEN